MKCHRVQSNAFNAFSLGCQHLWPCTPLPGRPLLGAPETKITAPKNSKSIKMLQQYFKTQKFNVRKHCHCPDKSISLCSSTCRRPHFVYKLDSETNQIACNVQLETLVREFFFNEVSFESPRFSPATSGSAMIRVKT